VSGGGLGLHGSKTQADLAKCEGTSAVFFLNRGHKGKCLTQAWQAAAVDALYVPIELTQDTGGGEGGGGRGRQGEDKNWGGAVGGQQPALNGSTPRGGGRGAGKT